MSVVQPFHRVNTGQTLRVVEDPERGVYWCNMHANLAAMPGRACFSTQLVDDIVAYQRDLAERLRPTARPSTWGATWTCSAA